MKQATNLFREGLRLHIMGNLGQAEALYKQILRDHPKHFDALHMAGILACQSNQYNQGIAYLYEALEVNPDSSICYTNLGKALHDSGRIREALSCYEKALSLDPLSPQAHNNLGYALNTSGECEKALGHFKQATQLQPDYPEAHNNMGIALFILGNHVRSVASYARAIRLRPHYPEALYNLAKTLSTLGKPKAAVRCLRRAIRLTPRSHELLNSLGENLRIMGRYRKAESCFKQAARLRPEYLSALENLAVLYEKENCLDAASKTATQVLKQNPESPLANLVAATCLRRHGKLDAGLNRLQRIDLEACSHRTRAAVFYERGTLYDRLGYHDAAFEAYHWANAVTRARSVTCEKSKSKYVDKLNYLIKWFSRADTDLLQPVETGPSTNSVAFLVGFPRSGTTLLEQILAAHSHIGTVEEKPLVVAMSQCLKNHGFRYPHDLFQVEDSVVEDMRREFFSTARKYLPSSFDGVIVDKLPLNITNVGLIYRVFPEAKILVALRHPYDACLSCFMQNFQLNESMVHFLDLEDTARVYDLVMTLWKIYAGKLPIDFQYSKYEKMITDYENTTKGLFDFLEVPMDLSVINHYDATRRKAHILTPSYQQVSEPIYRRSMYRWKNYRKHLDSIVSILRPHAEFFKYRV